MQYDACRFTLGETISNPLCTNVASAALCAGLRHTAVRQRVTWFSSYNLRYDRSLCPVDVNLCFVFRVWEGGRKKEEGGGGRGGGREGGGRVGRRGKGVHEACILFIS